MIALILSMIKLGLYFPAPHAPLGAWFYVSTPLVKEGRGWGLSAGYSNEPVLRPTVILGRNVHESVGKNAYFLSGTKNLNKDLDFDFGLKWLENMVSPFVGISFKFGSLEALK